MKQKKSVTISPIPKHLHFIWLGPTHPPYLKKFKKTFQKYAPGYSIKLWTDKDITKHHFPITYPYIQNIRTFQGKPIKEWTDQKTMYKSDDTPYTYSKWAMISDLMRYEIISIHGGYYFDANMMLFKDITQLFNRPETFIGCNELGTNLKNSPILSNSFFGAIPNSPILKRLLTKSFLNSMDLRSLDVDFVTGPGALRNALHLNDNYYILPPKTFYPYILPWTADGNDHPLRRSTKPKCSGTKRTKKRSLKMKEGVWLELPCHKYKGSYGIKIWESGGSWARPQKWYEYSRKRKYAGGQQIDRRQTGGVACVPCIGAAISPVSAGLVTAAACVYGKLKKYTCTQTKKKTKKKKKKKGKTKE